MHEKKVKNFLFKLASQSNCHFEFSLTPEKRVTINTHRPRAQICKAQTLSEKKKKREKNVMQLYRSIIAFFRGVT
jgi:hypothetical protein